MQEATPQTSIFDLLAAEAEEQAPESVVVAVDDDETPLPPCSGQGRCAEGHVPHPGNVRSRFRR
jgi:hypothetical protein